MSRKEEIISKLEKISQITEGKTLMTSSMEVVDYSSWAVSFWKNCYQESCNHTVGFIKDILTEAIDFYKSDLSEDLLLWINQSLKGLVSLAKTYHDKIYLKPH